MPHHTVIITAGGVGSRMGSKQPKQMLLLAGQAILAHTLSRFENHAEISSIILTLPDFLINEVQVNIIQKNDMKKVRALCPGGKERQDSIRNALEYVPQEAEVVLIHDGVRPLVSDELISNAIRFAEKYGAAVPAVSVKDTIKTIEENRITGTPDRSKLKAVQTPQAFNKSIILKAYEKLNQKNFRVTDDASLVEHAGFPVMWFPGDERNIKITTPMDLTIAELLLKK